MQRLGFSAKIKQGHSIFSKNCPAPIFKKNYEYYFYHFPLGKTDRYLQCTRPMYKGRPITLATNFPDGSVFPMETLES